MFPKLFADRISINYLRPKVPKGCPTKICIMYDIFFIHWLRALDQQNGMYKSTKNEYLWENIFEAKPGGVR